jgi:GTP pyrophosphokinase
MPKKTLETIKPEPAPVSGKNLKNKQGPSWLAELAEAHGVDEESEEFVDGLKRDFFSHRIFLFTPHGDVIDMPTQSTPVDFAYAIHTHLGDHMAGAKVNGKLVSFDTKLGNGDIVEILEKNSARPTAKWLDYARTSMARRHIRSAIEEQEKKADANVEPKSKAEQKARKKKIQK